MVQSKAILFDFDGVIADTEPIYDDYINNLNIRYNLGIENLTDEVKGITTSAMIEKYFGHLDSKQLKELENEILQFELSMDIPPVPGALEFIQYLIDNKYRIALVTSSQQIKMERALKLLKLEHSFDTIVTANRITIGKPHPMCFLLAAEDLNIPAHDCIVFEDSIHGIKAGLGAGMKVIGLTTSLKESEMKDMVYKTIPNLSDLEKILSFIK